MWRVCHWVDGRFRVRRAVEVDCGCALVLLSVTVEWAVNYEPCTDCGSGSGLWACEV